MTSKFGEINFTVYFGEGKCITYKLTWQAPFNMEANHILRLVDLIRLNILKDKLHTFHSLLENLISFKNDWVMNQIFLI